jgi:WD40 repeat protein
MTAPLTAHPDPRELADFAAGKLSDEESAAVEEHVGACEACSRALSVQPPGSLLLLARAADAGATMAQPGAAPADPRPAIDRDLPPAGDVPADLAAHPRYRVTRLLGQGGMGAVYQAEHRLMERTVALKVIHRQYTADADAVERFRCEVKTAAQLHHPSIVAAYDAEQAGDTHFLVMEYVPGRSLAAHLREKGQLPVREACDWARQAALGLQYAHERGMVHRDVKPDNLMVTDDGQVKILDFGLSRLAPSQAAPPDATASTAAHPSRLTAAGTVMGTPDYIAPEQAGDARAADTRADVYALGCTLYHMLTGRVPFPDGATFDKVVKHKTAAAEPLAKLRPGVPAALASVVAKMMAKSPADRYQTLAAVAQALGPFARQAPAGPWRRWFPALEPLLVGAGATVLFICCCLAVGWGLKSAQRSASQAVAEPASGREAGPAPGPPDPSELANRAAPADALSRDDLPEAVRQHTPPELIALLGDPRWRVAGGPRGLVYSLDGKRLAAYAGADVVVFDTATGWPATTSRAPAAVNALAINGNGQLIAAASGKGLTVWHADGTEHWTAPQGVVRGVAFSPNGLMVVATGADGSVGRYDAATGRLLPRGPRGDAQADVVFAPNGTYFVTTAFGRHRVNFWDAKTGERLTATNDDKRNFDPVRVAFSQDGKFLYVGGGGLPGYRVGLGVLFERSLYTEELPQWGRERGGPLQCDPDGQTLLTARRTLPNGGEPLVIRRDARTGGEVGRYKLPAVAANEEIFYALSPDGATLAYATPQSSTVVRFFDARTGAPRPAPEGHAAAVWAVAVSPDGRLLASASRDHTIRIWGLNTGRMTGVLAGHTGAVRAVAFNPDGTRVATGSLDGTVRVWDVLDGKLLHTLGNHTGPVNSVAFSPDGRLLASGGSDRQLKLYDAAAPGAAKRTIGSDEPFGDIAFSPDGRLVAAAGGKHMRVYDLAEGRVTHNWDVPGELYRAAFRVDGRAVAAAGAGGVVCVWDLAGGERADLTGPAGGVEGLAFDPAGRLLATTSHDGKVRAWEASRKPAGQKAWQLLADGQFASGAAFTPDGRHLAVGCPDGTVAVLRLANRGEIPRVIE